MPTLTALLASQPWAPLFAKLNFTRDSATWVWGRVLSAATLLASGTLDLKYWGEYLGLTLTDVDIHRVVVGAAIVLFIAGTSGTSALRGKDDPEPPPHD